MNRNTDEARDKQIRYDRIKNMKNKSAAAEIIEISLRSGEINDTEYHELIQLNSYGKSFE